jgi:hypothetical protein
MIYSRWGGLGNHRYQTGFSGDTWVGWPALQFQPYFTAAASNVAYGWWGHDIGGHMGGATEPELYARWVQFGALSPSLRLHATKDPLAERRPWKYPAAVREAARAAFHLRYHLLPYVYTMARVAHDTSISLCRPMYYEYPEEDAAYAARYQYFFGDQMIAAPIVHPADPETGLATTDVWIPEGTWIEYTTKETLTGPRWVRMAGDLNRVPMLVRAGAILPLAAPFEIPSPSHLASGTSGAIPHGRLVLSIFPGQQGTSRLYEDDGLTEGYLEGHCEWTEITARMDDPNTWMIYLAPVEGRCDALPSQRGYEIRLEGSNRPDRVLLNGTEISNWSYDPKSLTTIVHVSTREKGQPLTLTAVAASGLSALGENLNRELILSDVRALLGPNYPGDAGSGTLLDALLGTDAPGRADAIARLGGPFARIIEFATPEEAAQQLGRVIVGAPTRSPETFDVKVTWALFHGEEAEQRTVEVKGTTESQILDAPFAFDGQVRAMHWTADVELTWRGETLAYAYRSHPLFPTIYAWRALVYDQDAHPLALGRVMDAAGIVDDQLDWKAYVQTAEGLQNVNQPHAIYLSGEYAQALGAGARLAAYLVATVISPDEREAVVRFQSTGPIELYLNGHRVEEVPVEQEDWLPDLLRRARRTVAVQLRPGRNTLVVHTQPPMGKPPWWYLGAAFTTPDGEWMTDLAFE